MTIVSSTPQLAEGLHGHRLSHDLEAWWYEHGGHPGDPAWAAWLQDYRTLIDGKWDELTTEHVNVNEDGGKAFGMSKAGGCTRAAVLKALGYEPEPFSGSTRFTFFLGHSIELMAIASLRALGYEVNGAQEPVYIGDMMASYSDAIMPDFEGQTTIVSVKSQGFKKSGKEWRGKRQIWVRRGFPELPFSGVREAQPGWWAQVQAEMRGSGARQALILVAAKDIVKAMEGDPYLDGATGNGSLTWYAELIPYDEQFVENHLLPVWALAKECLDDGEAGPAYILNNKRNEYVALDKASTSWKPNADRSGTFNYCAYCDMFNACKEVK